MDNDVLQRLMMDDALGALEPDARVLLEEYFKTQSAQRSEQDTWQRIAATAARAISDGPVETLPEFPRRRLQWSRFERAGRLTMSAAAMVLIGLGVGLHLSRSSTGPSFTPNSLPSIAMSVPRPVTVAPQAAATIGVADFWSTQRLLASALSANRQPRPQWQWIDSYSALHSGGPR